MDEKQQEVYDRLHRIALHLRALADRCDHVDFGRSCLSTASTIAPIINDLLEMIARDQLGSLMATAAIVDVLKDAHARAHQS